MSLLYYYIISIFFLIIFLEVIFVLLWVFKNNVKTKLFLRVIAYLSFILYWIYLYTNIYDINIPTKLSAFNVISLFNQNFLFAFYNPIIPIVNLSLLQILIITIFSYTIFIIKDTFLNHISKKKLILFFWVLILWIIYKYLIPDNVWDTWYREIAYSNTVWDILAMKKTYSNNSITNWDILLINTDQYWIWFQNLLQFISKITFNWNINYTFFINYLLDLFNIILIFILSKQLWKNNNLSLWNSLLYVTSIPVLRFFSWWHLYVFATTLLLILIIFLFKFKESNYDEKRYLVISILSCLVLIYTHNIFILLPLLYPLFFLIFFDKKLIKKFFTPNLILFYTLSLVFIIPAINIKTLGDFYIWAEQSNEIYKNLNILLDNLFQYIYIFIFTPYNPFLNSEINSYFFIFLLVFSIIFYWWKKDDYKILLFFIILYFILILPYSLRFLPILPNLNYLDITEFLKYNNYKNFNWFVMLTDVMIKWSITLFIFIIFSWNILEILQSFIKRDILKKTYIIVLSGIIILIPIYNYKKIVYYFNVQNDYMYIYNHIDKVLDKNTHYNVYYDTLWRDDFHKDEFRKELKGLLNDKWINFMYHFVPDLKLENISDLKKNSIYIVSSSCYTRHFKSKFNWQCIINDKLNSNIFVPLLEKENRCETYDRESYCIKDKIKFWIYKINKNEKIN